ncbi:MAG: efflux RND transporter permease subunit, partial [Planctomycetes bacterium]|nr:efflux RND transporter permease subunit [Planctomycetota bacterium]
MIRGALKNPYAIVVAALVVVVLGITSYRQIPADLLPIFETPAVQIITFYPGMPPEVMERDITSRMERWTAQSVGIEHQEAKSMLGVSIVKDFFREDISMDSAMSQVTSYAMSDLYYLPPGTVPPMVMPFDPTASVPLALVTVSSPEMSEKELYDIAYFELRNRLQAIQGVIAPAVYGGKLRRILAYV